MGSRSVKARHVRIERPVWARPRAVGVALAATAAVITVPAVTGAVAGGSAPSQPLVHHVPNDPSGSRALPPDPVQPSVTVADPVAEPWSAPPQTVQWNQAPAAPAPAAPAPRAKPAVVVPPADPEPQLSGEPEAEPEPSAEPAPQPPEPEIVDVPEEPAPQAQTDDELAGESW
ncbi:MAG: hypothetical protein FWE61_00845 [Micrococcales bacterium]|nr:hypothetical protein [Micrococcales bacterium]